MPEPPVARLDWLAGARDLIDRREVDLVTFDVFDTLVWRSVATPADQFHHVAVALREQDLLAAHVTPLVFTEGRVRAERVARAEVRGADGHPEVRLDEIWARMPEAWCAPDRRRAAAEVELTVEAERLRVHADATDLLRHAHSCGVRTALVSDVYLTADQLRRLLDTAGVPLGAVDRVVTSADRRLGKADGLLAQVIRDERVRADRTLHLGDNPISDVATARKLGCHVVATDVPPDERVVDTVVDAMTRRSRESGTDSGVTAAIRTTLVRAGDEGRDPVYQFGAAMGGPVFAAFAAWVSDTASALGVSTIHHLLREGAFVAELAGIVRPDGPAPRLVHASRWVDMRAAVISGTGYEIARAVLRRAAFEAQHVTECFGVDRSEVERVIGAGRIPDDRRLAAFEALAADHDVREQIVSASAELRTRLLRHLDTALLPDQVDGRARLVLCDIGWGGTIQEGLTDILRDAGRDVDVIGLYLLLSEPGVDRVHQGARMLGFLPAEGEHARHAAIVSRNPELLEELCTPPLGTLVDITEDGEPVLASVPDHAPDSRSLARRAVVDFSRTIAELGLLRPDDPLLHDVRDRAALLDAVTRTLQAPDPVLARRLAVWSHDDVAGTAAEGLVDASWRRAVRHLDVATARGVSMREIFWLAGAAAIENPVLAAQLDAVRLGVSADRLAPPSELGRTSIAVYAPASDQAVLLDERVLLTGAHGWTFARLAGAVRAVRDVRIDFGDRPGLVELAFIEVRLTTGDGASDAPTTVIDVTRTDHPGLAWGDARPLGPHRAAVGATGHVVVPVPDDSGAHATHVDVRVAFRAWPGAVPEPRVAPVVRRARRAGGRVARTTRSGLDRLTGTRRRPGTRR